MAIGFLGAGKMATALARGFLNAGLVAPNQLWASDPFEAARTAFALETGGQVTAANREVVTACDIVIIAVKPGQVAGVLVELREVFEKKHLLLSIAAGVTLEKLEYAAPEGTRVIRVMPNTPALVGASASAYALGSLATKADAVVAQQLLGSVGLAMEVPEKLLDAVTGLSGSGPAYGFMIIEALADGGVAAGLPRDIAQRLAAQTMLGAAKMVLESGQHPGALKDAVCSPGGTTIEAVHELERAGLRAALIGAVRVAADKAKKLA
ncbi:MAG TPA: pyrroline-5-carboxylate reductase [Candidatus Limnocylindria bacterium]|nr:pyrroline-5-carboxylate reductase [Candidatus Limnocylindria bacterium]